MLIADVMTLKNNLSIVVMYVCFPYLCERLYERYLSV